MYHASADSSQAYRSYVAQCEHYLSRPHTALPSGPIKSAAAWRSAELRSLENWRYRFSHDEIVELELAIAHGKSTGRPLAAWTKDDFPLPTLSSKFPGWRAQLENGLGLLLLSGIPVARWGLDDCECLFWSLGLHLGIPGAQNPQGDLLGHVTNTGRKKDDALVRLYQTPDELGYHCDAADVVGLLCIEAAVRGGASRIASSVSVWNELWRRNQKMANRLFQPMYVDLRNEQREGFTPWNIVTPCTYDGQVLRTFYHSDYFKSVSRHKQINVSQADLDLVELYDDIANSPEFCVDMQLEPGDIQLISDHTIIHARTAYEDSPSQKRHLLRLWLSL